MRTYYLILQRRAAESPLLIKRCKAEDKHMAAVYFIKKIEHIIKHKFFTFPELLEQIKEENELNTAEKQWIKKEGDNEMDL